MNLSTRERKLASQQARRKYPEIGNCEVCGEPATDRHHKDMNPFNHERSNVAFLCRKCHMQWHFREGVHLAAVMRNLEKAHANSRWENYEPTKARSGDPCPKCGRGMTIKATHYRRDGARWSTIGCRPVRGGCGYIAGAYPDGKCRKGRA